MKIREIIVEVGDNPYAYGPLEPQAQPSRLDRLIDKIPAKMSNLSARYKFTTESGIEYIVYLDPDTRDEQVGLSVAFAAVDPKTGKATVDITQTGDAPRIFSTVYKIMRDYIAQHNPAFITFTAKNSEPTRVRLYNLIARQASKWFPNYQKALSKVSMGATIYKLVRAK